MPVLQEQSLAACRAHKQAAIGMPGQTIHKTTRQHHKHYTLPCHSRLVLVRQQQV